jgi:phage recombination protein Bet
MTTSMQVAPGGQVAQALSSFTPDQKQLIKDTVAKGCTDDELKLLMHLASAYGLDPFAKEIWAIKVEGQNKAALIMTSRDGYLKVAQRDPNYMGIQAAVVRKGDAFGFNPAAGTVEHSFGSERGTIIGAWAIAHHRMRMPVVCFVDFAEYKGGSPVWTKYPSAMIQKVAEVFVLKRQFGINGLVTKEEMDADEAPTFREVSTVPAGSNYPGTPRRVEPAETSEWKPSQAAKDELAEVAKHAGLPAWNNVLELIKGNFLHDKFTQLTHPQFLSLRDNLIPAEGDRLRFEAANTIDVSAAPLTGPAAAMAGATPLGQDVAGDDEIPF